MNTLMFIILQGISLLFYAVIVVLSIIPLDPARASRTLYLSFILFGIIFYILGTFMHTWLTLMICESLFDKTWKKRALALLPLLMALYIVFVIYNGS